MGNAITTDGVAITSIETPPAAKIDLPWRRSRGTNSASKNSEAMLEARKHFENEMVGFAEDMKSVANTMHKTLKSDNKLLEGIADMQDKSLDAVKSENEKGRKLMRSG